MQFMNCSLDKLAKNLSDKDFKYLIEEFGSKNLELLKQKGTYPCDDGKISDGHIDVNDYLTCKKTWNKFEMKNMGDYHDHYLKKRFIIIS